jgi:magnesium chelatase family protein
MQDHATEASETIRRRVAAARKIQAQRLSRTKIFCNARMGSRHIKKHCSVDDASCRLLESAIDKLGLSARAYNRILKIARTIADLEKFEDISTAHISEAIQYRNLDRGRQFK